MDEVAGSIGSAAQSLLDPLRGLPGGAIAGVLVILLGVAVSFRGYAWRRGLLAVGGLVAGAMAGLAVAGAAGSDREGVVIAVAAGAVAGAVLAYLLSQVALVLFGASAGGYAGFLLYGLVQNVTAAVAVGGVLAVAGAILAIKGQQIIFIVVTSVVGGAVAGMGAAVFPAVPQAAVILPCVLGGLAFQLYMRTRSPGGKAASAASRPEATAGAGKAEADSGNRCPSCGYRNSRAATTCGLCSTPLSLTERR